MTGDNEGAGNPPPFPRSILEPTPGVSEAEYRQSVKLMEAVFARHRRLIARLADLHTATGLSAIVKNFSTVLAFVEFLGPDIPPAIRAFVFDLLPPLAVTFSRNLMRGTIAAAVAELRSAGMRNSQIEPWLDGEIKKRPTLDFNAGDAVRWFTDCTTAKTSAQRDTLRMFSASRPDPSLSMTEDEAKEWVVGLLDTVVARKVGPQKTNPRRRG